MQTSNAHNVIRATMKALLKQNSPKQFQQLEIKISEVIEKVNVRVKRNKKLKNSKSVLEEVLLWKR